jgi:hypothetical protein
MAISDRQDDGHRASVDQIRSRGNLTASYQDSEADNGEIFTLPPAPEAYEPAPPGEYRLKTTGEVVVNPDFTCVMTVHLAQNPAGD